MCINVSVSLLPTPHPLPLCAWVVCLNGVHPPDTVMPGTVESLYKVAAPPKAPLDVEDSLARAGEGGSDGLDTSSLATSMDREREAAIEREMVSTDAVQFYLKVRCGGRAA